MWDVHKYTNDYIRFADTKAAFVIAAATALIGTLVSSALYDHCFRLPLSCPSVLQCVGFAGLAFLAISLILAITVIRPRLWNKTNVGFIFWESIAGHRSHKAFTKAIGESTAEERTIAVSDHLLELATIARLKYHFVNWAIYMGVIGSFLAGIVLFAKRAL